MRESVFIRMQDPLANLAEWQVVTRTRAKKPRVGSLKDAAKACGNRRVVLIIPGDKVLLTEAEVPTRNRQRLLKALPYTLEEYLIEDVEKQHFAVRPRKSGNLHPVAIIARNTLDNWLKVLKESVGIRPDVVVPDILCVPRKPAWSMIIDSKRCYVRTGACTGFVCQPEQLLDYLEISFRHQSDSPPASLHCWTLESGLDEKLLAFLREHNIELKQENFSDKTVTLFARHYNDNQVINLLQGSYMPGKQSSGMLRPWIPVAASLLVWLAVVFVSKTVHYFNMKKEYRDLHAQAAQIYRSVFPGTRSLRRMRSKMAKHLQTLRKQKGVNRFHFIELLGVTGDAIKNIKSLQLTNMRYSKGEMNLYFQVANTSDIDIIENSIRRYGLVITRGAASRTANGYTTSLKISGGRR